MKTRLLHIHGDNIVECERTLDIIKKSLISLVVRIDGPIESPFCPLYILHIEDIRLTIKIRFFPGFNRWNNNIIQHIQDAGGVLREAADAIVTEVNDIEEVPLFAIEYCGAIPAGNQAWQRSGRAYSFGRAKIPYFYIAELGGHELSNDRSLLSARLPNSAVPFSYIAYSISEQTPVLPIIIPNLGTSDHIRDQYKNIFSFDLLLNIINGILLNKPIDKDVNAVMERTIEFIEIKAKSVDNQSLSKSEWRHAFDELKQRHSLLDYLINHKTLTWKKKAYISALTTTAKNLIDRTQLVANGVLSSDFPICYFPSSRRNDFKVIVESLYPSLSSSFLQWLSENRNLVICWIMGFKPRGDDARPDRGLAPLARMLVGEDTDLLTVVYGPALSSTWDTFVSNPSELMKNNGLWEGILGLSDAVLIDSSTDNNKTLKGYLKKHWHKPKQHSTIHGFTITAEPDRYGEHDIDTILHLLLSHMTKGNVYEGMCNPPGGDWSGVSLFSKESILLRWLTLPRVSGDGTKRPDHVFQIFDIHDKPILLIIESKDTQCKIENNIGPYLESYMSTLLTSPASIECQTKDSQWCQTDKMISVSEMHICTGVAFFGNKRTKLGDSLIDTSADIAFSFEHGIGSCSIEIASRTTIGKIVADFVMSINAADINVKLRQIV